MHYEGVNPSDVQVGNLVRYRPELLNEDFLEQHGTVAVDCVFTVLAMKTSDGKTLVKAQVPGTPFTREISADLLQTI